MLSDPMPPTPAADRPYFRWFLEDYCPRRGLKPRSEEHATELLLNEIARLAVSASKSPGNLKTTSMGLQSWSNTTEGVPA
jgi:hypothetical protein